MSPQATPTNRAFVRPSLNVSTSQPNSQNINVELKREIRDKNNDETHSQREIEEESKIKDEEDDIEKGKVWD